MADEVRRLSLEELIRLGEKLLGEDDAHIFQDAFPYLQELVALRKKWEMRCFHPDCDNPMTGGTVYPITLAHCSEHRELAERINTTMAEHGADTNQN